VVLLQLGDGRDWWSDLLQSVIYAHLDSQLVDRVKEDLSDNVDADKINMANKFVFHPHIHIVTVSCIDDSIDGTDVVAVILSGFFSYHSVFG